VLTNKLSLSSVTRHTRSAPLYAPTHSHPVTYATILELRGTLGHSKVIKIFFITPVTYDKESRRGGAVEYHCSLAETSSAKEGNSQLESAPTMEQLKVNSCKRMFQKGKHPCAGSSAHKRSNSKQELAQRAQLSRVLMRMSL
jgi:hypothetical protein